jgi:6-phosphogluconate dehydrogenase
MAKQQIGLTGLAVMGQNLALNFESKGFSVAVHNRTTEKMTAFIEQRCQGKNLVGGESIEEFVGLLEKPRKIVIMVKAGKPVDAVIDQIRPHLDRGDLLIDAGNSWFLDTERRLTDLAADGILYIGTGVSGGEEGALKGPSIMPGGSEEAYDLVKDILESAAAQVDGPCCTYIGPRGAGHYVKMVHNGIEYGIMQCMAEVYHIMSTALGMDVPAMAKVFQEWTEGELGGYLMDITADIFTKTDPEAGKPIVELILDKAKQKGTGKWTSQNAMDLGVAVPTIDMAVEGRILSGAKDERVEAEGVLRGPGPEGCGCSSTCSADADEMVPRLRDALYVAMCTCYAQGFALMREATREYEYELTFPEVARIWKGGCIIRSKLLDPITEAYRKKPDLANLLLDDFFADIVNTKTKQLRTVVCLGADMGVPMLGLASSLGYIDSYRTARLPQNLTQAQRDYFGAHTYERVDREGSFHTDWLNA